MTNDDFDTVPSCLPLILVGLLDMPPTSSRCLEDNMGKAQKSNKGTESESNQTKK